MNSRSRHFLLFAALGLLLAGCATVPYTNRKQINFVPESQEIQLGLQAYQDVQKKNKISTDPAINALVQRVGKKVAAAAEKPDWDWQFTVIDDPKTVNAFCLPGGKIAVYTGILPLTKDDSGLAVVLAHETAHALAHHGAERMSDQTLMSVPLEMVLQGQSQEAQELAQAAFGIGVVLPFSRKQESEADHIGLILMAKAEYDPRSAVPFWGEWPSSAGARRCPRSFPITPPTPSASGRFRRRCLKP